MENNWQESQLQRIVLRPPQMYFGTIMPVYIHFPHVVSIFLSFLLYTHTQNKFQNVSHLKTFIFNYVYVYDVYMSAAT